MATRSRKTLKSRTRKKLPTTALPAPPSNIDPVQRYSLRESAATLRISMPALYVRMAEGRVNVVRDGGRTFILGSELINYAGKSTTDDKSRPAAPRAAITAHAE